MLRLLNALKRTSSSFGRRRTVPIWTSAQAVISANGIPRKIFDITSPVALNRVHAGQERERGKSCNI